MRFKLNLCLTLSLLLSVSVAQAAKRNLCDDLVESNTAQTEVDRCVAKFGESDTYKEYKRKEEIKSGAKHLQDEAKLIQNGKVSMKKFSEADLDEISFGKSFFAVAVDYSKLGNPKEKRLTESDDLCAYLGYSKAIESTLSPEINPRKANKNGLTLDKSFFGNIKEEPKIYEDNSGTKHIRKYVSITCARLEQGASSEITKDLKKIVENVITLSAWENTAESETSINSSNRSTRGEQKKVRKEEKTNPTPFGHKVPDFMKGSTSR